MHRLLPTLPGLALAVGLTLLATGAGTPRAAPGAPPFVLTPPLRAALAAQPALWGPRLHPARLEGKVVLLTFFASWCLPCRHELAALSAAYGDLHPRGVEVVAINYFETFEGYSSPARLAAFLERMALPYPVIAGDEALSLIFGGITRIPTVVVFDRAGRPVHRFQNTGPGNAALDEAAVRRLLRPLL